MYAVSCFQPDGFPGLCRQKKWGIMQEASAYMLQTGMAEDDGEREEKRIKSWNYGIFTIVKNSAQDAR